MVLLNFLLDFQQTLKISENPGEKMRRNAAELACFIDSLQSQMYDEDRKDIDRFHAGLQFVFYSLRDEELLDLLDHIDVNDRNYHGDSALHLIVYTKNNFLKERFSDGLLDVDCHTLRSKIESIILKLLSKGAEINGRNNDGITPLSCAAVYLEIHSMCILLQNKADPEVKNFYGGDTTLLQVVKMPYELLRLPYENLDKGAVVRLLLASGANVHATDENGRTALEHVAFGNDVRDSTVFTELLMYVTSWGKIGLLDTVISRYHPRSELRPALVEYVLALKCASLDCSKYAVVEKFKFDKNFISPSLAKQQIEEIKKVRCGSYSLYDVFDKYRDPTFVCDKNVEDAVNKASFKIKYVDYGSLLKVKFVSAKKRYNMMVEAHVKLTDKLPNEIVWKILTYLSDEDLESVTTAVSL